MELENKVLSKEILYIMYETGCTLSTAESCTSGRVAESITLMPGSSEYFVGGIVAYSDNVKIDLLGVEKDVIEAETAVCENVAKQMVIGACDKLSTKYAVATTGFAGPGGGSDNSPIGTIWIACGTKDKIKTLKLTEDNGRELNVARATNAALALLLEVLKEDFPQPDLSEVEAPVAK